MRIYEDACFGTRLKSWLFAGLIAKSPTPAQNFDLPILSLLTSIVTPLLKMIGWGWVEKKKEEGKNGEGKYDQIF